MMKKLATLTLALVMTAALTGSVAASSIAGKVWFANSEELDDSTLMYGVTASLSLSDNLWVSGMYLTGAYDDVFGSGVNWDSADGEVLLGYSFELIDVGVGGRYSLWTFGVGPSEQEYTIVGPMAYIAAGDSFWDSPLGWYAAGSYMFLDLGDAYDNNASDTYEHYNVEAGLSLILDPLTATVGYRYKDYVNFDNSSFSGVAASVGFGF